MFEGFDTIATMLSDAYFPRMVRIRQNFDSSHLRDIPAEVRSQLEQVRIISTIRPGAHIAVTAGSRGIANIAEILREICRIIRARGASPFLVPAMGSHGGATAEGQRAILESYGITEDFCGAPIRSSMETIHIGSTEEGHPVFIDKLAAQSDGIVVVGRIKAHTDFRGPYESGLMKMMVIGLGKQYGAEMFHASGAAHMAHLIPLYGKAILRHAPILFGVAILENAYDQTYRIEAVPREEFETREPLLLAEAKAKMGTLLFPSCDVLIVDYIGKDISGDGMDPNVTGTFSTPYASGGIKARKRVVLDVTDASHGCCVGVGMADATTKRLFDKMDFAAGYANSLTCTIFAPSRLPLIFPNDKMAIAACLKYCGGNDRNNPQVIRIRDTMHIGEIWISEAMLPQAEANPQIEILSSPQEFLFDAQGNLSLQ